MKNTNLVVLCGNLTRDCETSSTSKGDSQVEFGIAVNDFNERVDFFECVWYGEGGMALSPYLKKGVKINLIGRLRREEWQKDGSKHSRVRVKVSSVEMLIWPEKKTADEDIPF